MAADLDVVVSEMAMSVMYVNKFARFGSAADDFCQLHAVSAANTAVADPMFV